MNTKTLASALVLTILTASSAIAMKEDQESTGGSNIPVQPNTITNNMENTSPPLISTPQIPTEPIPNDQQGASSPPPITLQNDDQKQDSGTTPPSVTSKTSFGGKILYGLSFLNPLSYFSSSKKKEDSSNNTNTTPITPISDIIVTPDSDKIELPLLEEIPSQNTLQEETPKKEEKIENNTSSRQDSPRPPQNPN